MALSPYLRPIDNALDAQSRPSTQTKQRGLLLTAEEKAQVAKYGSTSMEASHA